MAEPMSDDRLQEIRTAYEKVSGVFGTDWPLDYDYEWPEVVCRYEDEDAPFMNVWIELFTTGQRPDLDVNESPLAEWLAGSIKVIPALLAEVDRLREALADEVAAHAKTFDNFESFAESTAEVRAGLSEQLAQSRTEVERLRDAVDLLAKQLQGGALDTKEALQFASDRLAAEDVEGFLKRERDEYEPRGECWNTVDDVLDSFRLHMVTGTPLTEPKPVGHSEDPWV